MSKGAKDEKSMKKMIKGEKTGEEDKNTHPGALELNRHVRINFRGSGEVGKIIKIRPIESQETKNNQLQNSNINKDDSPKNEYSYEYYIHLICFDRRNDHWVKREDILETKVPDDIVKDLLKKKDEKIFQNDENEGMDKAGVQAHEEATKIKTIDEIVFGNFKTETWYFSPLPEEYHQKTIYICEFCLNFYKKPEDLKKHMMRCNLRHPPGNEIYRDDDDVSVFEVDGKLETIYCENLCYIAKMFLDHKNVGWDVDPFLFYILTKYDKFGYHMIGYFSKEKDSQHGWNLSCILTFPFYQGKGYGKFLIEFSYLLSKKEDKWGTPERPLSDLGFSTYFSFWTRKLCEALKKAKQEYVSINELAELTHIKQKDIHSVLYDLKLLQYHEGQYIIIVDPKVLQKLEEKAGNNGYPVYPEKLVWTPYKVKYEI